MILSEAFKDINSRKHFKSLIPRDAFNSLSISNIQNKILLSNAKSRAYFDLETSYTNEEKYALQNLKSILNESFKTFFKKESKKIGSDSNVNVMNYMTTNFLSSGRFKESNCDLNSSRTDTQTYWAYSDSDLLRYIYYFKL